jgi:hypothetical protein
MRIQLTSEEDLFFLHVLEVSEDDFLNLKAEQGIVVDFASFPEKIVSLLEKCMQSRSDPSKYTFVQPSFPSTAPSRELIGEGLASFNL